MVMVQVINAVPAMGQKSHEGRRNLVASTKSSDLWKGPKGAYVTACAKLTCKVTLSSDSGNGQGAASHRRSALTRCIVVW